MYYCSVHTFIWHKLNILALFRTIFWKISEKVWRREALYFAIRRLFDSAVWYCYQFTAFVSRLSLCRPVHALLRGNCTAINSLRTAFQHCTNAIQMFCVISDHCIRKCKKKQDGIYGWCGTCTSYLACTAGKASVMDCPHGTVYDTENVLCSSNKDVCDCKYTYDCV